MRWARISLLMILKHIFIVFPFFFWLKSISMLWIRHLSDKKAWRVTWLTNPLWYTRIQGTWWHTQQFIQHLLKIVNIFLWVWFCYILQRFSRYAKKERTWLWLPTVSHRACELVELPADLLCRLCYYVVRQSQKKKNFKTRKSIQ